MKIKVCKVIGHRPEGTITGFRNIDAAAIMRCRYCDTPIVSPVIKASGAVMMKLYGQAAVEIAMEWMDRNEPEPPKRWTVYNQDAFKI